MATRSSGSNKHPDACDGGCFHLVQKGNRRIEIHFAAPLAQTVNVVVYGGLYQRDNTIFVFSFLIPLLCGVDV